MPGQGSSLAAHGRALFAFLASAFLLALCGVARADAPPPGADWSQAYIDEADGTQLHADVLRPSRLPKDAKTPVILSIGPYFNHSGQTGPLGPVEDTPFDPVSGGPSSRFYDFVNGAHLMDRGYTYVMVDLRGFGGSTGCLDWAGPGEQADVVAAVEWAAKQPWSTGKVGMYGKSYDAVTGLIGDVHQPHGLEAVVAQEPVYDLYRYLYMNRVRFENSLATPALYDAIAGTPGTAADELAYNSNSVNDTARPGCPALNHADQQDEDHQSAYWTFRDLIAKAKLARSPLFMTQGFLENNTKPDGAWDFFDAAPAPKRGWFGMWEHVRGNDTDEKGRLKMGRNSWFDEVMRFYDQYLKGAPAGNDPALAVESSDGKWRAEDRWPPADAKAVTAKLKPGTYVDHAQNNGSAADGGGPLFGDGVWTFSPPLAHQAHLAGIPHVSLDLNGPSRGNNVVDVYDVAPDGTALLISRGAYLMYGPGEVSYDLYGDDWILPAGHRVGVLVTSSNIEWWQAAVPTGQQITVKSGQISLPFLTCTRTQTIQGDPSTRLDYYRANAGFKVDPATIDAATDRGFALPKAAASCAPPRTTSANPLGLPSNKRCVDRRKFSFRIHQHRKRIVALRVYVNGKLVRSFHRRRISRLTLRRLPRGRFTLKIVATASNGQRITSVRAYRGCRKSRAHTHVTHRRRR